MGNYDQLPFGGGVSMGIKPGSIASNSLWASCACVNRYLNILIAAGAGALVINLQQATSSGGAGAKALLIERIARKTDVGVGVIKDIFVSNAAVDNENPVASLDTTATAATQSELILLRVRPQDLDLENGFSWVRAQISGAGAAAGCVLYLPEGPVYMGSGVPGVLNQ